MSMKILTCISVMFILYRYTAASVSNTTFESMKIGVSHFNMAGNKFFNLIRAPLDPNNTNIDDFKEFSISLEQLNKSANYYLCYYILLVIGATFVILIPFVGIILMCCRCCKRCGARPKAMDPPNARCKIISYGIVLFILATAMLLGTILCLFNNQIVHETLTNQDKSINIFDNLKMNLRKVKQALNEIKDSINNVPLLKIDSQQMQDLSNKLDDGIKAFSIQLIQVPDLRDFILQTKTLKMVTDQENSDKAQQFVHNLNVNLTDLGIKLQQSKETIKEHLLGCTSEDCNVVRYMTDQLKLSTINQTVIDKLNATLAMIKSPEFQNGLAKIISFQENNEVNMKLILNKELKDFQDSMNDKKFSDAFKSRVSTDIDIIEGNITSLIQSDPAQDGNHKNIAAIEFYRFYFYITACIVVLLIVVCFYMGLLFGTFGERASDDAGCCNRRVGSRFMIGAIVLIFLFSSSLMIGVVGNMLTTGIVHTELCRYSVLSTENDAKVLDFYIKMATTLSAATDTPQGLFDGLFNKCPTRNLYSAFPLVTRQLITKNIGPMLEDIDRKMVSLVLSQINSAEYLNNNPFYPISSINLSSLVESIGLLSTDSEMSDYLTKLLKVTKQNPNDVSDLDSLYKKVIGLRTTLKRVVQYLDNSETEFRRWKANGQKFENNKIAVVKLNSPEFLSALQRNLINVLNAAFDKMFLDVSCSTLGSSVLLLFRSVCREAIDPMNGTWYGLGFFLLLTIPALVFACLLSGLYNRLQKYFPDKEEADYNDYINFYARSDSGSSKNRNSSKKSGGKGYKPIPLQTRS